MNQNLLKAVDEGKAKEVVDDSEMERKQVVVVDDDKNERSSVRDDALIFTSNHILQGLSPKAISELKELKKLVKDMKLKPNYRWLKRRNYDENDDSMTVENDDSVKSRRNIEDNNVDNNGEDDEWADLPDMEPI